MRVTKLKKYVQEKQLARCQTDFQKLIMKIHFKYPKLLQRVFRKVNELK